MQSKLSSSFCMCRVSVIVPVYKAEKYIRRCLDSLLVQTLKDFELILVDDGSPDCSGAICDEYSQNDSRVRVIHKSNGGVSSARQAGLDVAVGEYVIHADPDDWVEVDMLEELYSKAVESDADMVFCDFYQDYANGRSIYVSQKIEEPIDCQTVLVNLLEGKTHGACWNKLVRRAIIKLNDVNFIRNVNVCEDRQFNISLLLNTISIMYMPKAYYHYCIGVNANSLTKLCHTVSDYKSNKYFIDFAAKKLSEIPYYRDRYIVSNMYYVVMNLDLSQELFTEVFGGYVQYVNHYSSKMKRLIVYSGLHGFKHFWYYVGTLFFITMSFLTNLKKIF